ncbi:hypothetical protein SteCoe_26092 [Stentor coeruleus]|uniref:DUF3447 domain-containing protein n=1 Tax=Stentor coeruleus TaxID=5963 RepID=A0A1R2BE44_9CILI|nr:hypothetical protein SteCoe_26092 [Stentor coeruleus]
MGCFQTSNKAPFAVLIKNIIEKNNIKLLLSLVNSKTIKNSKDSYLDIINLPITKTKLFQMNALGYSLYIGRYRIFEILHKFGCSLSKMDELFYSQGVSALDIICFKGFSDIIRYYLPFYIEAYPNGKYKEILFSIEVKNGEDVLKPSENFTPIQTLVRYGHIQALTVVCEFFIGKSLIPHEFDLNYCNEEGENSALIACRYGNYAMVKFLYHKCGCKFTELNKAKENAIQIAVAGSRVYLVLEYTKIVSFLVNVVGVNITYNYEETLLLAENRELIAFIECALQKSSLPVRKEDLEKKCCKNQDKTHESQSSDGKSYQEQNFIVLYRKEYEDYTDSVPSSIADCGNSITSFVGSMLEFHK